jgi:hypothetical protein
MLWWRNGRVNLKLSAYCAAAIDDRRQQIAFPHRVREGVMNWNRAIVPSLHHRKEGWPSGSKKYRESSTIARPGVVFG